MFLENFWFKISQRKVKRRIIGINNKILAQGKLTNVQFDIIGNNNHLEIRKNAQISNILIYIRGNNHRLQIEENCIIKGGSIWFEDDNCNMGKLNRHSKILQVLKCYFV